MELLGISKQNWHQHLKRQNLDGIKRFDQFYSRKRMAYKKYYEGKTVALVGRRIKNEKAELFMQKYGYARLSTRRTIYGRKRISCASDFWRELDKMSIYLTIKAR